MKTKFHKFTIRVDARAATRTRAYNAILCLMGKRQPDGCRMYLTRRKP